MKPTAVRIDSFAGREIIYQCSNCGTSFAVLGERINFCFHCGKPVNWSVMTKLSKDFRDICIRHSVDIDEFEERFIHELNERQLEKQYHKKGK